MSTVLRAEDDSVFCAEPDCDLHVRPGDPYVHGWGNWAQFSNGLIIGRRKIEGRLLCDRCAARVLSSGLPACELIPAAPDVSREYS